MFNRRYKIKVKFVEWYLIPNRMQSEEVKFTVRTFRSDVLQLFSVQRQSVGLWFVWQATW